MPGQELNIRIAKIQDLEFFVDEKIDIARNNYTFDISTSFEIPPEKDVFSIYVIGTFSSESGKEFLKGKVRTDFYVEKLRKIIDTEKNINISDNVLTTLLSLSVTHARAIIAKNSNGAVHEGLIFPIINPTEIVKKVKNYIGKSIETNRT